MRCARFEPAPRETTCREVVGTLHERIDGRQASRTAAGHRRHLERCPDCTRYLQSYRATRRLVAEAFGAGAETVPPRLPEDLVRAVMRRVLAAETTEEPS